MVAKTSSDIVMLYNEIKALIQINKYAERHIHSIPKEVANSIPVAIDRGVISLEKPRPETTRSTLESQGRKLSNEESENRSYQVAG